MNEREFDYINVIPFVDIMLVLLAIVLTTSTFLVTGVIPVELPRASKKMSEALPMRSIGIDMAGNLYFNDQPMTLDELKSSLQPLSKEAPIVIRADRGIRLQIFVDVLDMVKALEFKRVGLEIEDKK
ncbi:MAG: biopolymer transporter ExbD [Nitrospirota bacterium]